MLWRRYHAQTQTARETEGRQKTNEIVWLGEYSAGSLYRSIKSMKKPSGNKVESARQSAPAAVPPPLAPPSVSPVQSNIPSYAGVAKGSMFGAWFLSSTARQANAMRKHVQKILDHQRDVLQPKAVDQVSTALADLRGAIVSRADRPILLAKMEQLEKAATDWLKPYPNAAWRENI